MMRAIPVDDWFENVEKKPSELIKALENRHRLFF